jgi:ATP synthase protein I
MSPTPNRLPKPWKEYGRYGSVGIELVLSLLLGLWLGTKADAHFKTGPYLTLVGIVFGAYAGFRVVWQVAKKMAGDIDRAERREHDARVEADSLSTSPRASDVLSESDEARVKRDLPRKDH